MTKDLLLEIGTEEIPARFLPGAIEQIRDIATAAFQANSLSYDKLEVFATPRRLTLIVHRLSEKQADTHTEQKGPALKAAYDENGNPTRALTGFCTNLGLTPDKLNQKEVGGNIYLFGIKNVVGKTAIEVLPSLLDGIIHKISFPKPMRWGYQEMRFARPIKWLVAMLDEKTIPLEIASVKSANITRGHRVLGSDNIVVDDPAHYLELLKTNFVIADQNERKELIRHQIQDIAKAEGGIVAEDEELLTELTFLCEYPTALAGHFDEKYLQLPSELVITPMREHQRYFPVYDNEGKLLNKFITIRNGDSRYLDIVAQGNEKVLRSRLADAEFFWQEDLATPLEANLEKLSAIVFHEKLGTLLQKVERIEKLAVFIGEKLTYDPIELSHTARAARLAKADLVSHVVYEFPELQGIMGEYYALHDEEDCQVATAIREHYLPRFAGDDLPSLVTSRAVAIADRVDSLMGFFAQGIHPTGSQDPYALRRAAMGVVQIIIKYFLFLPVREILAHAYDLLAKDVELKHSKEDLADIIAFFRQRLENILGEEGISYDIINAIIATPFLNFADAHKRASVIKEFRREPEFITLIGGFTRAANILRNAIKNYPELEMRRGDLWSPAGVPSPLSLRDIPPSRGDLWSPVGVQSTPLPINPSLFAEDAEKELYDALQQVKKEVLPAIESYNYRQALKVISTLSPHIDKFFTDVMVIAEEEDLRYNRLALLREIVALPMRIGALSELVEK
jgi:glycyl-tRNA synthetase beta chain